MVRRCKHDCLFAERVEVLYEAVDDSLQLPEFLGVSTKLCDGVKLVKEEHARVLRRELEECADVL